jgi:hypothetical protein
MNTREISISCCFGNTRKVAVQNGPMSAVCNTPQVNFDCNGYEGMQKEFIRAYTWSIRDIYCLLPDSVAYITQFYYQTYTFKTLQIL